MAKAPNPIRWNIETAAREFKINPRTLSQRLTAASVTHGKDKRYSTVQIVRAIYSDLESERIRKTRAEADQVELENAEARRELVPILEFRQAASAVVVEAVRIVRSWTKLTEDEQDEFLRQIRKLESLLKVEV